MSDTYWRWVIDEYGGLSGPCSRCLERDGQVKPLAEWNTIGCPPLHQHCKCRLVLDHIDDLAHTPAATGTEP